MEQTSNPTASSEASYKDSNDMSYEESEPSTYVEPLPESSRPRKDGPGGE